MSKSDSIESKECQAVSKHFGLLFIREIGVEAKIRPPKFSPGAVLKIEVSVFDFDKTMLPCRGVQHQFADIKR